MIFGDELIITRHGIHVSNKSLETIGIFPNTEVYILPFRTFEFRDLEPGSYLSYDLLITPIPPKLWPFVVRFVIKVKNRPGMVEQVLKYLYKQDVNILFAEGTRSGHHHLTLNVLGELKLIETMEFRHVIEQMFRWKSYAHNLLKKIKECDSEEKEVESDSKNKGFEQKVWWWYGIKFYYLTYQLLEFLKKNVSKNKEDKLSFNDFENFIKSKMKLENLKLEEVLEEFKEFYDVLVNIIQNEIDESVTTEDDSREFLRYWDLFLNKFIFSREIGIDTKKKEYTKEKDSCGIPTKKVVALAGIYLALKYLQTSTILLKMLEQEIIDGRNRIELQKDIFYDIKNAATSKEIYQCMENYTIPLRIILGTLLNYKNVYCDILKICLIDDALKECFPPDKDDDNSINQSKCIKDQKDDPCKEDLSNSIYLYNINYYLMVWEFPYFNDYHSFSFFLSNIPEIKNQMEKIKKKLSQLKDERGRPMEMGNRIDLDPIQISTLEFLSHAHYHRLYSTYYQGKTKKSFIEFPQSSNFFKNILDKYIIEENSASIAVASRNTDDYTLRICPLPLRSLRRFREITIDKYMRECVDVCLQYGEENLRKKVHRLESNSENLCDSEFKIPKECLGTSAGLLWKLSESLRFVTLSPEKSNIHNLIIWRLYNKNYKFSPLSENGTIRFLVQASGKNFPGFEKDWAAELNERFRKDVKCMFEKGHVNISKPTVAPVSGGRIFISLPFAHPMKNTWLEIIQKIGKEFGFREIDTVETYIVPVTSAVSERLAQSHGLLQILAASPRHIENFRFTDYEAEFTWLNSEYLAAISRGMPVVRLVDSLTIDVRKLRIGRDHVSLNFNILEPIENFEKVVKEAYKQLRDGLADTLGLS